MNYAPPPSLLSGIGYLVAATVAMFLLMTFWWLPTGLVERGLGRGERDGGRDSSIERKPRLAAGSDLAKVA
jgi:hypothetical protein